MKINYVIATYDGFCKRSHVYPRVNDVLKVHLNKIFELNNSLKQITVMKSKHDGKKIENYYNNIQNYLDNEKVKLIECENYGYSEGQWMKAYELDKTFDYYLFVEDDYCPNMHNFDDIFVDIYKKKFPNNIGVLCSLVEGTKNYNKKNNKYPIHWEGSVFMSRESLEKLYNDSKWNNEPRKWLDLIDKKIDNNFNWKNIRKSYIGGYYQLTFSHLFTLSGIEHEDYLDEEINNNKLEFPYWDDDSGSIWFYNKGDTIKKEFTLADIINSLIVPIQLSYHEYIFNNTNLIIHT